MENKQDDYAFTAREIFNAALRMAEERGFDRANSIHVKIRSHHASDPRDLSVKKHLLVTYATVLCEICTAVDADTHMQYCIDQRKKLNVGV